jgi:hypothetical protein
MVIDRFNHDSPCEARARGWNAGAFGILHILGGTAGLLARQMSEMSYRCAELTSNFSIEMRRLGDARCNQPRRPCTLEQSLA